MPNPNHAAERGTRTVAGITAAMMVVEIWAGWRFNSMALLADGWHMSTHALAIGLSAAAYAVARHYSGDPRFTLGTRTTIPRLGKSTCTHTATSTCVRPTCMCSPMPRPRSLP